MAALTLDKVYCCFYAALWNHHNDTVRLESTHFHRPKSMFYRTAFPLLEFWDWTHGFGGKGWRSIFSLIQVAGLIQVFVWFGGGFSCYCYYCFQLWVTQSPTCWWSLCFRLNFASLKTATGGQMFHIARFSPLRFCLPPYLRSTVFSLGNIIQG